MRADYTESLWDLHSCRHLKCDWTRPWATWYNFKVGPRWPPLGLTYQHYFVVPSIILIFLLKWIFEFQQISPFISCSACKTSCMWKCAPDSAWVWFMCARSLGGEENLGVLLSTEPCQFVLCCTLVHHHTSPPEHDRTHLPGACGFGKCELWSMKFTEVLCPAHKVLWWARGELCISTRW